MMEKIKTIEEMLSIPPKSNPYHYIDGLVGTALDKDERYHLMFQICERRFETNNSCRDLIEVIQRDTGKRRRINLDSLFKE